MQTLGTVLVILIIAGILALAVRSLIKGRDSACGCGNCSGCSGCAKAKDKSNK